MRVAYFPDSFHEINGVAHTSRHFVEYARRRGLPFLCIRAGEQPTRQDQEGELRTLDLNRGVLSFQLDKGLSFDLAYVRHLPMITTALRNFRPDLIHITGPSENGLLGAALALHLGLPLAASWHTNVHEYASRRSGWFLRMLPKAKREPSADRIEHLTLLASAKFYSLAKVLFAPNPGLCALLEKHAHRPCRLMQRGVDTALFSPAHRDRRADDTAFVLGFVGRLSIEKNVALLAEVQKGLTERGITNFRFCIVGQGAEETWLREHLPCAEFTGVLHGEGLSRAYANMDLFVFPSHTDTFGNVVLEALASGVPALVTPDGGPVSIIAPGETGLVARDEDFPETVASLIADPTRHAAMRKAARVAAGKASWDSVFDAVYQGYREVLHAPVALAASHLV